MNDSHDCGNCGHAHEHAHTHHHGYRRVDKDGVKALRRALYVTILFMLIEAVGGYLSNSLALLSDAAHMLTDVGAMLLSLFVFWVARRPANPTMSFGYHRVEILGALVSGLSIWFIAGLLVYQAVARLMSPPEVKGFMVFVVATIGLLANVASLVLLHSAREHSLNIKAAYLHVVTDSLGSVAAIITGVVLWVADWRLIDPLVTIVLALLMLYSSWSLVKESVGVLMESTPIGVDPKKIAESLRKVKGVQEVHDLHIWTLSSGRLAMSVHLVSHDPEREVLGRAHAVLEEHFGIIHTTIQIEHPEKFSSERCYDCKSPGDIA